MENEVESWKTNMQEFFEWYADMLEVIQKVREHGYSAFMNDVPISIEAFRLRLKDLQDLQTPKSKGCKQIKNTLEESMKHRIRALQLEAKYFQDIQDSTFAGRLGAGATAFPTVMAGELLQKALTQFQSMFHP